MSRRIVEGGVTCHLDDRDGRAVVFIKGELGELTFEELRRVVQCYDNYRKKFVGYQNVGAYNIQLNFHLTLPIVRALVRAHDRWRKRLARKQKVVLQ